MMRLRRSDFALWDVHKRRAWRRILCAWSDVRTHGAIDCAEDNLEMLAFAMKRANGRALYILIHSLPWLAHIMCAGILAASPHRQNRDALVRYRAVHTPEERQFMVALSAIHEPITP